MELGFFVEALEMNIGDPLGVTAGEVEGSGVDQRLVAILAG